MRKAKNKNEKIKQEIINDIQPSSDTSDLDLEVKKLTPAQYWEWRCTIEELTSSELNFKRVQF